MRLTILNEKVWHSQLANQSGEEEEDEDEKEGEGEVIDERRR